MTLTTKSVPFDFENHKANLFRVVSGYSSGDALLNAYVYAAGVTDRLQLVARGKTLSGDVSRFLSQSALSALALLDATRHGFKGERRADLEAAIALLEPVCSRLADGESPDEPIRFAEAAKLAKAAHDAAHAINRAREYLEAAA